MSADPDLDLGRIGPGLSDPDPDAEPGVPVGEGDSLVWSNIYLSFPLLRRDRAALDAYLAEQDSSLSMRLRASLAEIFRDAGVELPRIE